MKHTLVALGLAAALTPALAQQSLIPAQSELTFVSRQMGVPVQGKFTRFDAQLAFDPAKPETSRIAFSVDTGSATLGVRESDAELPKPVWFNVAQFPKATFESSTIKRLAPNRFEVAGKLTIKGVSASLTVPVALTQQGATTVATGSFTIQRLTFRIGEKEWADTSMVADPVQVNVKMSFR